MQYIYAIILVILVTIVIPVCVLVLPLTYFHPLKSARAHPFPQSVKARYLRSGPISVDTCMQ